MEKVRIFTETEKNQAFDLYSNGKGLKEIAEAFSLEFQASKHEKKDNKEVTTPARVNVNGSLLNLHQFLKKLDKARFEDVHTTSNYVKGGRLVVDKVSAARDKFLNTLEGLTGVKMDGAKMKNGIPDLNTLFAAAKMAAEAADKKAAEEAEARKESEAAARKEKKVEKALSAFSIEELEALLLKRKAAATAK